VSTALASPTVIDREEVVLRAAALILDRLRNGAAVWTDVLDEVGELLPTRRAAQQAAWQPSAST